MHPLIMDNTGLMSIPGTTLIVVQDIIILDDQKHVEPENTFVANPLYCKHVKHRNRCRECGQYGFKRCEHGRNKYQCKDCGTGHCEHGRPKHQCKDCGTGQCDHGKWKHQCKECGTGHCEHGKRRSQCKDCGTGYCEHGKYKYRCKECKSKENQDTPCERRGMKRSLSMI
jgi:hypothetical protein